MSRTGTSKLAAIVPDGRTAVKSFARDGFVNLDYLKGAPFKIAGASTIGALMRLIGGTLGPIVQTDDLHAGRR